MSLAFTFDDDRHRPTVAPVLTASLAETPYQTMEDADIIRNLVKEYVKDERTIIL